MDWNLDGLWILSTVIGGGIVTLFHLVENNYSERKLQTKGKVDFLLAYIKDYEELEDLYRFVARFETHVIRDESGEYKRDASGTVIYEDNILDPEPRFNEALKLMKGTDFDTAITNKILTIQLAATEAIDIALELDPSGELKHQLVDLYAKTIWSIGIILKDKTTQNERNKFGEMVKALTAADETRRNLRANVQKYLK